jgi:transcription elongation GreA/GreB family factor
MEIPLDPGLGRVRVITPETPVAKALLGKCLGEEIAFPRNPPRMDCVRLLI